MLHAPWIVQLNGKVLNRGLANPLMMAVVRFPGYPLYRFTALPLYRHWLNGARNWESVR